MMVKVYIYIFFPVTVLIPLSFFLFFLKVLKVRYSGLVSVCIMCIRQVSCMCSCVSVSCCRICVKACVGETEEEGARTLPEHMEKFLYCTEPFLVRLNQSHSTI